MVFFHVVHHLVDVVLDAHCYGAREEKVGVPLHGDVEHVRRALGCLDDLDVVHDAHAVVVSTLMCFLYGGSPKKKIDIARGC